MNHKKTNSIPSTVCSHISIVDHAILNFELLLTSELDILLLTTIQPPRLRLRPRPRQPWTEKNGTSTAFVQYHLIWTWNCWNRDRLKHLMELSELYTQKEKTTKAMFKCDVTIFLAGLIIGLLGCGPKFNGGAHGAHGADGADGADPDGPPKLGALKNEKNQ
jgi:hypothetical protein